MQTSGACRHPAQLCVHSLGPARTRSVRRATTGEGVRGPWREQGPSRPWHTPSCTDDVHVQQQGLEAAGAA
jgi:hypothetical protein